MALTEPDRLALLEVAWQAIREGRHRQRPEPPESRDPECPLGRPAASFVTLTAAGRLRGCCGTIEAWRPLLDDVHENAWRTAYDDPRFDPVARRELDDLELEISVLSPLRSVAAASREALLETIEPGRHGLVIACGRRRATFLPKVWQSLPEAGDFVSQLMVKAGILDRTWPADLTAWVYTAESIRAA